MIFRISSTSGGQLGWARNVPNIRRLETSNVAHTAVLNDTVEWVGERNFRVERKSSLNHSMVSGAFTLFGCRSKTKIAGWAEAVNPAWGIINHRNFRGNNFRQIDAG
jgi:hypothetical protein